MIFERYGFLFALLAAAFALAFAMGEMEPVPRLALGPRSRAREASSRRSAMTATLLKALAWFSQRLERALPRTWLRAADQLLAASGDRVGLEPAELFGASALGGLLGALLGWTYTASTGRSPVVAIVLAVTLGAFPYFRVSGAGNERLLRIQQAFPQTVDLLALGLSAGLDFPAALRMIVERSQNPSEPLLVEFRLILEELALGKTRREVLEGFSARAPLQAIREFVGAVIQADEEGTPLARVLAVQATVSRQRRSSRAEELASRTALQLILPMALAFLAVLILIAGPLVISVMRDLGNVQR